MCNLKSANDAKEILEEQTMTREQTIKALEYCANNDSCVGEECPYYDGGCEKIMPKDALTLIRELMADNERLALENKGMEAGAKYAAQTLRELTVIKMQSEIESRCVKKGIYPRVVERVVDEVAKEIVEGKTDAE